ncbi:MAG: hypothetical protein WCW13_05720 [archaeon]|jgi:hypothetical protein
MKIKPKEKPTLKKKKLGTLLLILLKNSPLTNKQISTIYQKETQKYLPRTTLNDDLLDLEDKKIIKKILTKKEADFMIDSLDWFISKTISIIEIEFSKIDSKKVKCKLILEINEILLQMSRRKLQSDTTLEQLIYEIIWFKSSFTKIANTGLIEMNFSPIGNKTINTLIFCKYFNMNRTIEKGLNLEGDDVNGTRK